MLHKPSILDIISSELDFVSMRVLGLGFLVVFLLFNSNSQAEERILGRLFSATQDNVIILKVTWGAARLLNQIVNRNENLWCDQEVRSVLNEEITDYRCYLGVSELAFMRAADLRKILRPDMEWKESGFLSVSAPLDEENIERRLYFRGDSAKLIAPHFALDGQTFDKESPVESPEIDCRFQRLRRTTRSGPSLVATLQPICRTKVTESGFLGFQ